jgi:antitoxin component YwqK of YwqJK toxin-antitoxin module
MKEPVKRGITTDLISSLQMIALKFFLFGLLIWILGGCSSNENPSLNEDNIERLIINYNEDSTKVVSFGFVNEEGQNGEWLYFDISGKISKMQNFKNGVLDGPVTEFRCCQKFSTYTYENGSLEGEIIYYSSEGYISSKGYFKHGKLNGAWVDFYRGELFSIYMHNDDYIEEVYQNNRLQGVVIGDEFFGCCQAH